MHKDTIAAIQSVVDVFSTRHGDQAFFRVFVMRKKTGGFWQMCIIADEGKEYFLPHLERIGCDIARMFGENLHTQKKGDYLVLS